MLGVLLINCHQRGACNCVLHVLTLNHRSLPKVVLGEGWSITGGGGIKKITSLCKYTLS